MAETAQISRCDGVMAEITCVSKKPLESEVAGDAFDFPVAIARGVKAAPSADFLGLFLRAFRLFGAPRLGLGTRALSGFGDTGGDFRILGHEGDLSVRREPSSRQNPACVNRAQRRRAGAGMMREEAWGDMMGRLGVRTAFGLLALAILTTAAHAQGLDPDAATEAYLATLSDAARARSDAYFEGGYWLLLINAAYAAGVALILLFTRLSSGMRSFTESILPWRWLQTFVYAALFIVVVAALTFPLTMYEGFTREHEYGMSNQTFEAWLSEYFISLAVNVVLSSIFITGIYAIVRRAPNTWWIWGTAATAVFMTVAIMLAPVYISPLFNDYTPMPEGQLKQEILSMARASGVPADNVYVVDQSRQTTRISANVQGIFGTTRISLNDNLLERGTPAEVKAVMGHEIGHYVLGHIFELIVYFSLLAGVGFAFVHFGFHALHRAFGGMWGVRDVADPAGLPVAFLLLAAYGLAATPVQNTITRSNEAEADIYGLNAAREPDGFATIALKLSEYRKLDPTPLEEFIFFTHPSGRSRISMAMHWKAENMNENKVGATAPPPAETEAKPANGEPQIP
jgi:STE24 endopeptidase